MKTCPDCVYYDTGVCRFSAPAALATIGGGQETTIWPTVAATDWCADGFNPTDGWYDPAPRTGPKQ